MMPLVRTTVLAVATAALAACSTTAAPPMSDPMPPSDGTARCNAAPAQTMVGQVATAANVERARTLAGARTARTIKPGMMVTMEYIEGRLNIDVDEKNVMTHIRCG